MRFHLGVPEPSYFTPDASWRPIDEQELSIWKWQFKALPISIGNMGLIVLLWIMLTPFEHMIGTISFPLPIPGFILCLVGVLIVHELIHAAIHPGTGGSPRSILGFWPSRMFLYTMYDGELTRNRFLFMLLMPFAVISIVPILLAAATQALNFWLFYITGLNAFLSSGDMLAAYTLRRIPARSIIRSEYWKAY